MSDRKETVRAWAYLGPDKNLAAAKLYIDKWRAQAAAGTDACTDPTRIVHVEIRPLSQEGADAGE